MIENGNEHMFFSFDPQHGQCLPSRPIKPPHHLGPEPVMFVKGRYVDLAKVKHKDHNTLYFGVSHQSKYLSGIWLGDHELTSHVKDVSIAQDVSGGINLIVKFINENGKLQTVKTALNTGQSIEDLRKELYDVIDKTRKELEDEIDAIDTSVADLTKELDEGKYNYHIDCSTLPFAKGLSKEYNLFKGDKAQTDSSKITLMDYTVKQIDYNSKTNELQLVSWPDACDTSVRYVDSDGKVLSQLEIEGYEEQYKTDIDYILELINVTKEIIEPKYIKRTSKNIDDVFEAFDKKLNENSSINDRLEAIEFELLWQDIK